MFSAMVVANSTGSWLTTPIIWRRKRTLRERMSCPSMLTCVPEQVDGIRKGRDLYAAQTHADAAGTIPCPPVGHRIAAAAARWCSSRSRCCPPAPTSARCSPANSYPSAPVGRQIQPWPDNRSRYAVRQGDRKGVYFCVCVYICYKFIGYRICIFVGLLENCTSHKILF